jgi:hypothetical protein
MNDAIERNLGPQPILAILEDLGLTGQDLVAASADQLSFKMVSRACKGRRLTSRAKLKVLRAVIRVAGRSFKMADLFNYS